MLCGWVYAVLDDIRTKAQGRAGWRPTRPPQRQPPPLRLPILSRLPAASTAG
jgi:hypothetical protein